MPEGQFLDRETIEYYLCSNGQEKVRKKFNYHFVQQTAYDCGPACCWLIVYNSFAIHYIQKVGKTVSNE